MYTHAERHTTFNLSTEERERERERDKERKKTEETDKEGEPTKKERVSDNSIS